MNKHSLQLRVCFLQAGLTLGKGSMNSFCAVYNFTWSLLNPCGEHPLYLNLWISVECLENCCVVCTSVHSYFITMLVPAGTFWQFNLALLFIRSLL